MAVEPAALNRLIETLEDPAQRGMLLEQMKTLLALKENKPPEQAEGLASKFFSSLSGTLDGVNVAVATAADTLHDAPKIWYWIEGQLTSEADRIWWGKTLGKFLIILAAGVTADLLARRLIRRPRRILEEKIPRTHLRRIPVVLLYGALSLLPIFAFVAAAYAVMPWLSLVGVAQKSAIIIVGANVLARLIALLAQMFLMPDVASLRIAKVKTEMAVSLMHWVNRFIIVLIYCHFANEVARWLGLPWDAYQFIQRFLGLVTALMLITLCLQKRREVAAWINRRSERRKSRKLKIIEQKLASFWHIAASVYILSTYVVWAFQIAGGFEYIIWGSVRTVIVLVAAYFAIDLTVYLGKRLAVASEDWDEEYIRLRNRVATYLPALNLLGRFLLYMIVLLALLEIWGAGTWLWLTSGAGSRMLTAISSIVIVLLLAVAVWEVVSVLIERYLSQTDTQGQQIQRSSRVRTLLSLARNALMVLLCVTVGMIVLSELGVNIAPLLAGAGVVGLALGFGSQTLVKDLITGIFMLLEDAVAVGDSVTLGSQSGTVEALSIRAIRLRDFRGNVHTIPFSAVSTVINMGRDYGYAVLDIGVSYREDTDAVVAVMREVGDELQNDPEFAFQILEPLEVQGINEFQASSVVIRARIKTLPLKQWGITREYNRLLKKRFDAEGIEMPYPHTTVYFGEDKTGKAPPLHLMLERKARKDLKESEDRQGEPEIEDQRDEKPQTT